MKFFGPDSGFYKMMQTLTDLLKINFLWLLCSLPIVSLGGATIAAYDVAMKLAAGEEGNVGRQFLASFKANFRNGIPSGLLLRLGCYAAWLDFSLFHQLEGNPMILLVMGIVAVFALVWSFLYAFALQARYENTLIRTLKNSADICTRYFLQTLILIVVVVVELLLIFWNMTTLFVGACIGPACIIYTVSAFANRFFRELEKEPGAVTNPDKKENSK